MEFLALVALGVSAFLVVLVVLALQSTRRELKSLQQSSTKDTALLLLQEQLEHLREQVRASLEGSTQTVSQQLAQIGGSVTSQLGQVTTHLSERLKESAELIQKTNEVVGERLDRTARAVGDVQGGLARLDEATRRMIEVGQNINSLQQILQPPKLRGGFGETLLENLLSRIFPREYYMLQHVFRTGATVDAAIRIGDGLVPVDAKFPLENFKKMVEESEEEKRKGARRAFVRDVKGHVADIARKYILPDEGTFDFALMYIPAENVYYETIIKDEGSDGEGSLSDFALQQRVIPVSPNSFYAYLQAIVLGLKGLRVEKNARDIMVHLSRLQGDLRRFREDFIVLGKHVGNARNKYEEAQAALTRLETKLEGMGGGDGPPALDSREFPVEEK